MYEITARMLVEQPTAVARRRLEVPEIADWIGGALARVMQEVGAAGLWPTGVPFARYLKVEGTAAGFDVEAGVPVSAPLPWRDGAVVEPSRLPGGPAAVTIHEGPYEAMMPAYEALEKWIADEGGVPDGPPWECYLSEPWGDPATWRTEIVQPYTPA